MNFHKVPRRWTLVGKQAEGSSVGIRLACPTHISYPDVFVKVHNPVSTGRMWSRPPVYIQERTPVVALRTPQVPAAMPTLLLASVVPSSSQGGAHAATVTTPHASSPSDEQCRTCRQSFPSHAWLHPHS